MGEPVPPHFIKAAGLVRYCEPVFVAPAWRDIYCNDAERTQDFAEAVATEGAVVAAWRAFGYRTVDLPRTDVAARVGFVRHACG